MNLQVIDHIAVAVRSIPEALGLFRDALGGKFISGGDDENLGIRTLLLMLPPGIKIELMQPIRVDSYLQKYLDKQGEGFHHMTIFVENVETAIRELQERGFETTDTNLAAPEWRETFLRPRSAFGTLIQVVDTSIRWDIPASEITAEDVVAGRVVWRNYLPVLRIED